MAGSSMNVDAACNLARALFDEHNERDPALEYVIAQDPMRSFWYAKDVLKGRFLLAEPVLAQSPEWGYFYARFVLEQPWPEAEPTIARSEMMSRLYMKHVLDTSAGRLRFDDVLRQYGPS